MMVSSLAEAADMMQGELHGINRRFAGVSTDTRSLRPDELFVALDGPNYSGRDFLPAAQTKRAAAAVVRGAADSALPNISVEDTRLALGRLGAAWRRQMPARVVGLTGSNGKTTLKEMVASCLRQVAKTLATDGNLNNEIGVPLMLCRLGPEHEYAVIEMGANHTGEIAYLTELVAPDVVALTNASAAHLEGFGSIDGVANAKGEILKGSPSPEFAILNADDRYFEMWRSMATNSRVLSFGVSSAADVRATSIRPSRTGTTFTLVMPDGVVDIDLQLSGSHNVMNAAAAAAVSIALDISPTVIKAGLEEMQPVAGRLRKLPACGNATLYDDSYNANPASVRAAADFLASQSGDGWLVLGDMAELGEDAASLHADVGAAVRQAGVSRMFASGALSQHAVDGFGSGAQWFESTDALIAALKSSLAGHGPVNVLVKGSRSARMERVVEALTLPKDGGH
jgi:UDP-N-acetylmuramoyl-tripeptide--D-alanyl-D-alanine ligase